MQITARSYHGADDLRALLAFATTVTGIAPEYGYFHIGDILWGMFQNTVFDPQRSIWLWESADGELLAFAWNNPPGVVFWDIHPRLRGSGVLEASLLDWSEQHGSNVLKEGPDAGKRQVWIRGSANDQWLQAFFEQHGYGRDADVMFRNRRAIDGPIPEPTLPAGFRVRHVGDADEWQERVETHREVWHPSKVTLEAYQRLRQAPGYIPELDLVVETPDGGFGAYCICWLDPINHIGEFEPVGTRPAYRRLGLGKAVMLEGLRRLQARGAQTAIVYSEGNNVASNQLYRSVGFQPVDQDIFFTKIVS